MLRKQEQQKYCDWMEKVNIKNLHNLNDSLHWFEDIQPTETYNHSDAVCYTKSGRKITVELKTRSESNEKFQEWGNVFIEPKKFSHFTDVMESGYTRNENCLYINFTSDGVIVFSFNDLKTPLTVQPNHRQRNPKNGWEWEYETRLGISMKDALIYKRDKNGNYNNF